MGLAAARPNLVRAVVLNDIGPDIGSEGADFVRDFVGDDPALESLEACVTFLRTKLPPMSLDTDAAWRRMAELTYQPGPDGRFHPVWDTAIAQLLKRSPPDLWPLFGALCPPPRPVGPRRGQQYPAADHRHAHAGSARGHDSRHTPRHRSRADPDRTARARRDPGLPGSDPLNAARFIAAGFGTGYVPRAGGTVASAAAVVTGAAAAVYRPGRSHWRRYWRPSVAISRSDAPPSKATPAGSSSTSSPASGSPCSPCPGQPSRASSPPSSSSACSTSPSSALSAGLTAGTAPSASWRTT